MSAEHFTTVMSCDMRTTVDLRSAEYAAAFTRSPRWQAGVDTGEHTWACCMVHAHTALEIAAQTVADEPMDGISGDRPKQRQQAAVIIDAVADLVRGLALDAAHDSAWTAEGWETRLQAIRDATL